MTGRVARRSAALTAYAGALPADPPGTASDDGWRVALITPPQAVVARMMAARAPAANQFLLRGGAWCKVVLLPWRWLSIQRSIVLAGGTELAVPRG